MLVERPANVPVTVYENEGAYSCTQLNVESDSMSTSEDSTDDQLAPDSTHPDIDLWSYSEIKHSLKEKIRVRRESEGAEKIRNLFEPPKRYKLTPEEEAKNLIRKRRNRVSANKSRLKRIAREKNLEKEAKYLETDHTKLMKEVEELTKYKHLLLQEYKDHLPTCKTLNQTTTGNSVVCHVPAMSAIKGFEHLSRDTPSKYMKLENITDFDCEVPRNTSEATDTQFDRILSEVKARNDFSLLSKDNQVGFTTRTMNLLTASNCKLTNPSISPQVNTADMRDKITGVEDQGNVNDVSGLGTGTVTHNHSARVDAIPVFTPQSTYLQAVNNLPCQTMTECHDEDLQSVLNDLDLPRPEYILNVGHTSIDTPLPGRNIIQLPGNNITATKSHKPSVTGINRCPYLTENEKIDKIKSYLLYDL